tara:strand:+ start:69 stop:374 length:306 start_codon:yes stop_codon:yes gene_type:complete
METKKSLAYLRAKRKVEALKAFYSHLTVYVIINTGIILASANVFNSKEINFESWGIYITAFFWGIGLISHGLFTLYIVNFENSFLKRWEEKKMKQFLEDDI